jgi:hypothetical protein
VVGRLVLLDGDLAEPLHHAPADEPGDDDADREAVVRRQPAAVLLVGDENVVAVVQGVGGAEGRAVGAVVALPCARGSGGGEDFSNRSMGVGTRPCQRTKGVSCKVSSQAAATEPPRPPHLWQLPQRPAEADKLAAGLDADAAQEVAEAHACGWEGVEQRRGLEERSRGHAHRLTCFRTQNKPPRPPDRNPAPPPPPKHPPVQWLVETAHGPQLNPMLFFSMFSSLRRFPAHTSVIGSVTDGIAASSSIPISSGAPTMPPIAILWVAQSSLGTAPWLRT